MQMATRVYVQVAARLEYMRHDDRGQGTFGYVLMVAGILALVAAFIAAINGWFDGKASDINGF